MWTNLEESPIQDETISNAFCSRGIYQIRSDEEVRYMPRVQAGVHNCKMFISVDKTLFLLEEEPIGKCNILTFEVKLDCVVPSLGGNVLVCGFSNGEIHGISIRGQLLFRCYIEKDDKNIIGERTFVTIQQLDTNFYFICTNGSTYKLSDFDETLWHFDSNSNLSTISSQEVDTCTTEFNVERIFIIQISQEILSALFLITDCETEPDVIVGTRSYLYQRISGNDVVQLRIPETYNGIKHIYNIMNDILILTHSGHTLVYCPFTNILCLKCKNSNNVLIEDIIVNECNNEHIECLVLSKKVASIESEERNECNSYNYYLSVVEYPDTKSFNELELNDRTCWLVSQPKSAVNTYYIIGKEYNNKCLPTTLELVFISEIDPSDRFKKLILKGRLNEAEDYGKQFDLCLQPLYEARAKYLLIEMSSLNPLNEEFAIISEKHFTSLLDVFGKIQNKRFFITHRSFNLPTRQILEKYLKEVIKHLDSNKDGDVILDIREELDRLDTLRIMDPYEINNDWLKFVHHPNLVIYLMTLLKTDMPMACLIWSRHSSCILKHLTETELRKLLTAIPDDMTHFHLLQWLRRFIPIISNTHPMIMPYVMKWSKQKLYLLQHSKLWPEIGLEFCTGLVDTFDNIQFIYTDIRRQWDRNICQLRDLLNALQDLCVLKNCYNLTFSLDNYLQENINETAKCMLQRVHLDKLKSLVKDFLYPIYQEKGLSPITAIKCYIKLLVASRNSFSSWLERSVNCIELLHDEDDRLELALLVLQNAPVPWTSVAEPLIKLRYSTHPIGQKIKNEYEKQVIKLLKVKYNWPIEQNSSTKTDSDIALLMQRIVKVSLPEMIVDIQLLIKAAPHIPNGANFNVCYQLIKTGQIFRAYEFFKKIRDEQNGQYARDVVDMFGSLLENSPMAFDEESLNEQQQQIEFYRLLTSSFNTAVQKKRLKMIENRFILKHTYEIPIKSVDELYVEKNCLEYLELGITNIMKRLPHQKVDSGVHIVKYFLDELRNLSKSLHLDRVKALQHLCLRINFLPLSCVLTYHMWNAYNCHKDNKDNYTQLALMLIAQHKKHN